MFSLGVIAFLFSLERARPGLPRWCRPGPGGFDYVVHSRFPVYSRADRFRSASVEPPGGDSLRTMGSIVLKSLSVLLGIFFVFVGTMKLTSHISKDLHKDLRKEYVKYAKVFPLSGTLDFKVPSKWYRRVVGSLEIVCGLAMAIVPSYKVKNVSNAILLFLMLMAVYSHYMVNDKFERIAPALVFFFMLTGRLVIDWQLRREDAQPVTANGIDDKAKKQD